MDNNEKLKTAFISSLNIDESLVNEELRYQGIAEWDSITQMFLINELENVFEIQIDSEHILDINSFVSCKEVLNKYNIDF